MKAFIRRAALTMLMMAVMFGVGWLGGMKRGEALALSTNPVSDKLETTCLSIWATSQNKKWFEKNNK